MTKLQEFIEQVRERLILYRLSPRRPTDLKPAICTDLERALAVIEKLDAALAHIMADNADEPYFVAEDARAECEKILEQA